MLLLTISAAAVLAQAPAMPAESTPAAAASAKVAVQTVTISGKVIGCSGEHPILIDLADGRLFTTGVVLQSIVRKPTEVKAGAVTFVFKVPKGVYTVRVLEDQNGNGKLDLGILGPKEPAGFYRKFTAWRAPRFEDVKFTVDKDRTGLVIDID